jgi:hypothetical protein
VDAPQPFSAREIAFLEGLVTEGAEFLVVGRAATRPAPPVARIDRERADGRGSLAPADAVVNAGVRPPAQGRSCQASTA